MQESIRRNNNILLIFPPMTAKYAPNPMDIPVPHIGVAYIAALLKSKKYNVDIIDCPAEEINLLGLYSKIENKAYDIIGISTYYFNSSSVIRIVQKIRKQFKDTFIFLGGMLPTLSPTEVLKNFKGINCCVIGEGEQTVLELVERLALNNTWNDIEGLAYKNDENEIIFTPKRKLVTDLDTLPFPYRIVPKRELYTPVLTSRGCYGKCNFCSIESYYSTCIGQKIRVRNPIRVVDEIEALVSQGHDNIKFNDENFNFSSRNGKVWFSEFYNEIKKRNIKAKYVIDIRVNEVIHGEEEIKKFLEIGLEFVFIGVESFIQSHLDFFKKKVTVQENILAMKILDNLNASYRIGLLLFNPITTLDDIKDSLDIIEKVYYKRVENIMKPISVFQPVIAVAGTEIYEYVIQKGLYKNNGRGYRFANVETEIYYNIICKWSRFIKTIYENRFLVGKNDINAKKYLEKSIY